MSGLKAAITEQMKQAMKNKDQITLDALRLLQAAIKNREIELRPNPITDEEILQVIRRLVKQRKEAIEQFLAGGRPDLAEKEKKELSLLETFLPQTLSPEQTEKLVDQVIAELQAKSIKDMGPVIKAVIAKAQGACDNKLISELVRSKLSAGN
ncbi:MAG: GatB/YqeY domain-containing protein [Bdellovibrionaceae bacterium]|nr:GatB/YqeY domain-containing protein [Pseudobdellovibrionaceae bacterium]MDW8189890.1 GatB/YqeY domain-containing protein [Pseudobdellovibrionaceae bacterium]